MIHDGYTEFATIGPLRIEYRPLLHYQRQELRTRCGRFDWKTAHYLAEEAIAEQIVECNADWRAVLWGDDDVAQQLTAAITGVGREQQERDDARNLREGVLLEARFPKVARRDCNHCRKWWYDEETGKVMLYGGQPVRREGPTPCEAPCGCPKGTWSNPRGLSAKNRLAYRHYLECRAVGQFPDDAIVRRNAVVISQALVLSGIGAEVRKWRLTSANS